MKKLAALRAIFRSINTHPLAGKHRLKSYMNFIRWQLINIFNESERKVRFTQSTFLVAKKGMNGATGNIYMGLHEFQDMAFLLHFLRKDDIFFDIGANVGSYTVLASGHVGCNTFSFEPIPSTFRSLQKNIEVNSINDKVKAFNVGVGAKKGTLSFTSNHDTINHVLASNSGNNAENSIQVPVVSIDEIIPENEIPILMKIDVEGFETEVLQGMKATCKNEQLKGIIIELNGSGDRYGFDENAIHDHLLSVGFLPYEYDPFSRTFTLLNNYGKFNTIYLRQLEFVKHRIDTAEKIHLFSESF